MKWTARQIGGAIARQTLARKCVVMVDNCNWTGHECDILAVTQDLRIIDVEVKISRADLKADASKRKWWQSTGWNRELRDWNPSESREHPPKVWKHYYAMPASIWQPELFEALASPASGVLLLSADKHGRLAVTCERRTRPNRDAYRLTAEQAVDIARLANLRMWSAYENIDRLVAEKRQLQLQQKES